MKKYIFRLDIIAFFSNTVAPVANQVSFFRRLRRRKIDS